MTYALIASISIAEASATNVIGSPSLPCSTINLHSAVIAIIIGSVTGILLLIKKAPTIPTISV